MRVILLHATISGDSQNYIKSCSVINVLLVRGDFWRTSLNFTKCEPSLLSKENFKTSTLFLYSQMNLISSN